VVLSQIEVVDRDRDELIRRLNKSEATAHVLKRYVDSYGLRLGLLGPPFCIEPLFVHVAWSRQARVAGVCVRYGEQYTSRNTWPFPMPVLLTLQVIGRPCLQA
jgi:hypothetical protein